MSASCYKERITWKVVGNSIFFFLDLESDMLTDYLQ